MGEFRMPSLGADMVEGTLLEWLVKPGDQVHRGDLIAVVDTDKAAIDVEVFEDGVVQELVVPPGTRVPVGQTLALLGPPGRATGVAVPAAPAPVAVPAPVAIPAQVPVPAPVPVPAAAAAPVPAPAPAPAAVAAPVPAPVAVVAAPAPAPLPVATPAPRVAATPLVRRRARELGIELASVTGSGRNGAITRADVEAAAAARTPAPAIPSQVPAGPAAPERIRISPLARGRARSLGIDPATVHGTGPAGAITLADVEHAAEAAGPPVSTTSPAAGTAAPAPAPGGSGVPAAPGLVPAQSRTGGDRDAAMRRAIAALMARSKREIPHYYLSSTIDLSAATAFLTAANAARPVSERVVPAALLLRATALAARAVPQLNGFWIDDGFVPAAGVHLGVAVSLRQGGMIAPAIHDADRLEVPALMAAMRDLVLRARAGRLRRTEMTEGTLTVTNLGDRGVDSVFGVIYPPQVALVGFGRVVERPWAAAGMLGVRPVVTVTLSADHRATDGHLGGRFLTEIEQLLSRPEEL